MEFSIALPSSALEESQTDLIKSLKVGFLARSAAIFKIKTIYIYYDKNHAKNGPDSIFIKKMLEFLNTPPYLRKIIYPLSNDLKHAGLLSPINAPHHRANDSKTRAKIGDIRMGVILKQNGIAKVEIGLGRPVVISTNRKAGEIVNVKIMSTEPIKVKEISSKEINEYWGYNVEILTDISNLIDPIHTLYLTTSRHGQEFRSVQETILKNYRKYKNAMIIFGSPRKSVMDILGKKFNILKNNGNHFVVNMFPVQGTSTIRLEEAVFGTLSILRYLIH